MKHAHYIVTIPAGTFYVIADTTDGKHLDFVDFWNEAVLYRYFNPGEVVVTRYRAKEIKSMIKGLPVETFRSLQKYGSWR